MRSGWSRRREVTEPEVAPLPAPRPPRTAPHPHIGHVGVEVGIGVGGEGVDINADPDARWREKDPPRPDDRPGTPAVELADALGVDPRSLARLDDAARPEQKWARAFAGALWPVTWGTMIDRLLAPTASGSALPVLGRTALRDHAVDFLRGRGPLPAIRIGKQPYGILPRLGFRDPSVPGGVAARRRSRRPWVERGAARGAQAVDAAEGANSDAGQPGGGSSPILGTLPTSRALRVRPVLSGVVAKTLFIPDVLEPTKIRAQHELTWAVAAMVGLKASQLVVPDILGDKDRRLDLPYAHDSDSEQLGHLLDTGALTEVHSVIQALLGLALRRAGYQLDGFVNRLDTLREAVARHFGGAGQMPDAVNTAFAAMLSGDYSDPHVFTIVAHHAQTRDPWRIILPVADIPPYDPFDPAAFAARYPLAAQRPQIVDALTAGDTYVTPMRALNAAARAAEDYAHLRAAVAVIRDIADIEDRTLLLGETLDCASHRIDAWQTSRATRRLRADRSRPGSTPGVAVGAYGWVQFMGPPQPESTGGDGGFILAPSTAHAATAAVLRGASLTNDPMDTGEGPLHIDLSSTRVREALKVIDGMRSGQPLGALLGYRLERWLHDDELDRYVYPLRCVAPLVADKLTRRPADETGGADEAVSATEVIDGLRLLELPTDTVKAALRRPPAAYQTYLESMNMTTVSGADIGKVIAHIGRITALHDAVADVLLAESVHQLLQGSPTRAAAAADALAGDNLPPEIEVTAAPTEGTATTHRVLTALPRTPQATGWSETPRALMHPGLEYWAQGLLGNAVDVAVTADGSRTLADLDISALDLVVGTNGSDMQRFWGLLTALHPDLPAAPPDAEPPDSSGSGLSFSEVWAIAGSAWRLLAGTRAATADDLRRATDGGRNENARRTVDVEDLLRRVVAARDALGNVLEHAGPGTADILPLHFGFGSAPVESVLAEAGRRLADVAESFEGGLDLEAVDDPERFLAWMATTLSGDTLPLVGRLRRRSPRTTTTCWVLCGPPTRKSILGSWRMARSARHCRVTASSACSRQRSVGPACARWGGYPMSDPGSATRAGRGRCPESR